MTEFFFFGGVYVAISEGHGDVALELLKVGAETDKRDVDGHLAIDLAPDIKVSYYSPSLAFIIFILKNPLRSSPSFTLLPPPSLSSWSYYTFVE